LKGHGVAHKLIAADLAIATIATVGAEIEPQILGATKEDAAFALALDGYATAAGDALIIWFRQYLAELVAAELLTITTPLYPGTMAKNWLRHRPNYLPLVDGDPTGVKLTPSFLMTPCKSVSMVIGAGKTKTAMAEPALNAEHHPHAVID
jgi:hypothetical protein